MKNETKVYVGMDVHKDSVTVAVLPEEEPKPTLEADVGRSAGDQEAAGSPGELAVWYNGNPVVTEVHIETGVELRGQPMATAPRRRTAQ